MKRYKEVLTNEERQQLEKLISSGIAAARKLTRARILLKVDEGLSKTEISQVLDISINLAQQYNDTRKRDQQSQCFLQS